MTSFEDRISRRANQIQVPAHLRCQVLDEMDHAWRRQTRIDDLRSLVRGFISLAVVATLFGVIFWIQKEQISGMIGSSPAESNRILADYPVTGLSVPGRIVSE